MWFSFDGIDFERHGTEAAAKKAAKDAMHDWEKFAEDGWDPCAAKVCYGKVTHAVEVEVLSREEVPEGVIPEGLDAIEEHTLGPVVKELP